MPSSYTTDLPNDILIDTAILYYGDSDGLLVSAGLAIDAVAEKFKTTAIASYRIAGADYTKAITTALTFTLAHVITASKFGVILVQIDDDGNITTKVPSPTQAYNDAPTALAALPAPDAGNAALGYIAIANNSGDWIANTDDLTNASDVTTATFNNSTVTAVVKLGATRGGITFNNNAEWRNVPFDGASGDTAGLYRKTGGVPTLEGTILLFGPTSLSEVLEPGSTSVTTGTDPNAVMRITPLAHRTMLAQSAHRRYEALWKRGNGGTAKVIFPVGMAIIGAVGSQDNNEAEIPITVRALNNPDDIDENDEVPAAYYIELTGPDILAA